MDATSRHDPFVDFWIERSRHGNPMCVDTTMDWSSSANDSSGTKPTERGSPAGCIPDPWPLRMDFHWVPSFPWLLDDFLAQLGDYMPSTLNTIRTISTVSVRASADWQA